MSLPPILVINLERSTDRRQHMEKELGRFEVEYSFFPAVDGKDLRKVDEKHYSMRADLALNGVVMQLSDIGCSLTHARIYEKMIAEKIQELLVLEDDCFLDDHFFEVLECRKEWLPSGWRVINFFHDALIRTDYLGYSATAKNTAYTPLQKFQVSDFELQLIQFKTTHKGAMCYLINIHAARCLLKWVYPIRRWSDGLLGSVQLHKLDNYTLFPALVNVYAKIPTTIRRKGTLKTRLQSLYYAIKYRDARKAYVKFRVQALLQMLRSVCTRPFRTRV